MSEYTRKVLAVGSFITVDAVSCGQITLKYY